MLTYVNVKELPKDSDGDLTWKAHQFTGVQTHEEDCGSHGCTGHTYRKLVCTCGYVAYVSDCDISESEQIAIRKHRDALVDHHLGLRFY
jgi:hypothetical protein